MCHFFETFEIKIQIEKMVLTTLMDSNKTYSLSHLFYTEPVWVQIFYYSSHEKMKKWVQTCKILYYFVKKTFPGFFEIQKGMDLEQNLEQFCASGNQMGVEYLISKNISISYFCFRSVCLYGKQTIFQYLVFHSKRNLNLKFYNSCLKSSIEGGNLEMVNYLMNQCSTTPNFGMRVASQRGHLNLVQLLFSHESFDVDMCFQIACENGHVEIAKYLKYKGADIHFNSDSPFLLACSKGKIDVVDYLVSQNVDIYTQNCQGLKLVLQNGDLNLVKYFVSKGVDFCNLNFCVLLEGCKSEQLSMLKYLILLGVDTCEKDYQTIRFLSEKGNLTLLDCLIQNIPISSFDWYHCLCSIIGVANVNVIQYFASKELVPKKINLFQNNEYLLKEAVRAKNCQAVEYLVSLGANIHIDNEYILLYAVLNNHVEMVRFLVNRGANIHVGDDDCLRLAIELNYYSMVEVLIIKGANVNAQNGKLIFSATQQFDTKILDLMINCGANLNLLDETALSLASKNGNLTMVKFLDSRIQYIHKNQNEALKNAMEYNHFSIVVHLLNSMNLKNWFDLIQSVKQGDLNLVKKCVSQGTSISMHVEYPLQIACEYGHLHIVKYLVSKGSNILSFEKQLLNLAIRNNHLDVLKFLIDKGANMDWVYSQIDSYAFLNTPTSQYVESIWNLKNKY